MASDQTNTSETTVYVYDAHRGHLSYAIADLRSALEQWRLVRTMVLTEFHNRYKGTLLGAFWLTATSAISMLGLGVVYSQVFQSAFEEYLPYVSIGLIVWALISGFLNAGPTVFIWASTTFSQIRMPLSIFPLRLTGDILLSFFYRSLVVIAIMFFLVPPRPIEQYILALIGVAMLSWIGYWTAVFLGVIGTRFRDFSQLIGAFVTFSFFLTPIFWESSRLGEHAYIANFNPFYHFLNVVRGPLLAQPSVGLSFAVTAVFCLIVPVLGFALFSKFKHRIPYWI